MMRLLPTCSTDYRAPPAMQMYKVPGPLRGAGSHKRLQDFMETGASQVPASKVPSMSRSPWRMFTKEFLGEEVSSACPAGSTCAGHSHSRPTRSPSLLGGFIQPA